MNSLTSLGVLKDEITDPELLNALRRHTKQQNEIVNNFFYQKFFLQKQYTVGVGRRRGQSDSLH